MELVPADTHVPDAGGPHCPTLARASEVRGNLLGSLERRIELPRPPEQTFPSLRSPEPDCDQRDNSENEISIEHLPPHVNWPHIMCRLLRKCTELNQTGQCYAISLQGGLQTNEMIIINTIDFTIKNATISVTEITGEALVLVQVTGSFAPRLRHEPTCGAAVERRLSRHVDERLAGERGATLSLAHASGSSASSDWLVSAAHFKSDTFARFMYQILTACAGRLIRTRGRRGAAY